MYNMYLEKGQDNSYDNQWSGNPEIRGFQRNIYKSGNGYKLTPLSQAEREAFAKQLNAELKKAMDESKKSVKIGYGISEFGAMNSSTNEALKEYLYAIYPSVVNISTRSWPETIPVYYNGNYHDVKFTFKIADIEHQRVAEVRYTYGSSIDKQCYVFMISDGKMLAESIKKYAYSTYDSAMADYFMVPLNQYIKDKNSKLASLLWNGVKDLQINGWGLNIDGGKKYVKDYFKKGVDKYLDSIEKVVRTAGIEEVNIMSAEKEAPYAPVAALPENVAEPFSDEYFVEALKGKLNVDELTPEILADVTELDLSESYITEISGIEQCANLQSLNLAGNAVSDLRPLAGLTRLEELDLSGNSVSDLTPISGLESLTSLTLKNNLISDLSGLEGAAALSELDLAFNYISDITNISGLTKLTSLNLTDNNISNISALTNITALKTLYLGENNVAEVICYERGIRNRP